MTELEELGLSIRFATIEDATFIVSSWISSFLDPFRTGEGKGPFEDHKSFIDKCRKDNNIKLLDKFYNMEMRRIIKAIMVQLHPVVAFDPKYPNVILSWVCATPKTLFYAYTKASYRKLGYSAAMIRSICHDKPQLVFTTPIGAIVMNKIYE